MHNQRKPTHVKHLKWCIQKQILDLYLFLCVGFSSCSSVESETTRNRRNKKEKTLACWRYHGPFWSTSTSPYLNTLLLNNTFNINSTLFISAVAFSLGRTALLLLLLFFETFLLHKHGRYLVPKIVGFHLLFLRCLCCLLSLLLLSQFKINKQMEMETRKEKLINVCRATGT